MRWLAMGLVLSMASASAMAEAAGPEPVGVIFDTDIGNDVDDVLALGVVHALASRGHCRLLAVTITKDHEYAAPLADAVNTFYGRGSVPVGVVRGGVTPEQGSYLGMIREKDDGRDAYPHALRSGNDAPEATELLRRVLAEQADGSVAIVQVGFSANLARLLDSGPDGHSPLSGAELVRRKVRVLSIMAGAFIPIDGNPEYIEYNVVKDIPSARRVLEGWPTAVVFSGYEVGISVPYPATSIERDYGYASRHPLADAYRLYSPPPHNRPTWDLTSVLAAVLPDRGYFDMSDAGTVTVRDNGLTRFEAAAGGLHRYLILPAEKRARVVEALVQLSSQPPGFGAL